MYLMTTTWMMMVVAFIASAILCEEIAKNRGRDRYFYLFVGLLIGPLAVMIVLTPLPDNTARKEPVRMRRFRVVKGPKCPQCHREVAIRAPECPHCGHNMEVPWWDRSIATLPLW